MRPAWLQSCAKKWLEPLADVVQNRWNRGLSTMTQPTPRQLAAWIAITAILSVLSLFTYWEVLMLLPVAWLAWILSRRRAGTGPTDQ